MVMIRNANEIILNLLDFFRAAQPDLDTKPGTVARDLFIEAPAAQMSLLYEEISKISDKQSLRLVAGVDLDNLAKNFQISRKKPTASTGVALLTFSSINIPINIGVGSTITTNNGLSFKVLNGLAISPSSINFYKSVATKFRDQLDTVGITDIYAAEVTVACTSTGVVGNIGKFSLNRANISGVSNVTNINAFTGGTDAEADSVFRNRILSSFSGSSVGTVLGYQNSALTVDGVGAANVIEPGSVLMTRDGTVVNTSADGTKTIVTEGSGGKVDVVVLGSNLQQTTDSFIYQDKSNSNDPTNSKNNYVLGQIISDANKTINRKRIDNIAANQLPEQPVEQIIRVTGSISGTNFKEKKVDSLGRVSGNYELIKDSGVYGGSPWGFDTFHWISNKISLFEDDRIKGQFNGQDPATFTDILEIPQIQQTISIANEDSIVTSDRSIIQLLHTPATNVTRVFNVNTGERYLIKNQNLDNTGTYNTSGRIQISGNTLPVPTDVLQVDYSWIVNYDPHSDYDGLSGTYNSRIVEDSIDWGYSSLVKNEKIKFKKNVSGNFFVGTSSHPVSNIIYANKCLELDGVVTEVTSGVYINRLSVVLTNLLTITESIESVKLKNTNIEQYKTAQEDGAFTSLPSLNGVTTVYNTTIILPSDTVLSVGDRVTVLANSIDVFHQNNIVGTSTNNQITIPSSQINITGNSIELYVSYISNTPEIYSSATTSLPSSRSGNGFTINNNNGFTNKNIVNILRRDSQSVQLNFSNEYYVEINLTSTDYSLDATQVLSISRLSDGLELWNRDNFGTVQVGTSGKYQLILTGYNTPSTTDKVLVTYYATDNKKTQPFTYSNLPIKYSIENLNISLNNQNFNVPINTFINETGISFKVLETNTDIELFSVTDGYIVNSGHTAIIGSLTQDFSTCLDLNYKKVYITGANVKNNGYYDIISYNQLNNTITIGYNLKNINKNNISVIRLLDGQEIWDSTCSVDYANNQLIIPKNNNALTGDKVFVIYYNYKNLKQTLTKVISTTTDQVNNPGAIVVTGTTIQKASDIVFTSINDGLKLNISEAIRKALNINSVTTIPSNIKLVKIVKLEKVQTSSTGSDDVVSVLATYDLKNSYINDNRFYGNEFLQDTTLLNLEFKLPSTQNNILTGGVDNTPKLGDKFRVTFYYSIDDSENLSYTRNGTLYTNKKFALINKVYVNNGFNNSQATRVTLSSFTQPSIGSRYKAFYDYLAPKQNERIVITYNYNKIISDVTFNIEKTRPINADVLVRAAKPVQIDLTMNVVISDDFKTSSSIPIQSLRDKLLSLISNNTLGSLLDQITLINAAQGIKGISRARIVYFNRTGSIGQLLSIQLQNDEYFVPNNIIINTETI